MKRAKAAKRAAAEKGGARPTNFDEYLAIAPTASRSALIKMREAIRAVVPAEAAEVISYAMPAFRHNGMLVWFGGFRDHCSLFPTAAVMEKFEKELKGYSTSKGTIQFPLGKPLPVALIKKIVKARVAQNASKKR
jgi:uncharacterized protein YdhG (YjbR/CyaY superfamily)